MIKIKEGRKERKKRRYIERNFYRNGSTKVIEKRRIKVTMKEKYDKNERRKEGNKETKIKRQLRK